MYYTMFIQEVAKSALTNLQKSAILNLDQCREFNENQFVLPRVA